MIFNFQVNLKIVEEHGYQALLDDIDKQLLKRLFNVDKSIMKNSKELKYNRNSLYRKIYKYRIIEPNVLNKKTRLTLNIDPKKKLYKENKM